MHSLVRDLYVAIGRIQERSDVRVAALRRVGRSLHAGSSWRTRFGRSSTTSARSTSRTSLRTGTGLGRAGSACGRRRRKGGGTPAWSGTSATRARRS